MCTIPVSQVCSNRFCQGLATNSCHQKGHNLRTKVAITNFDSKLAAKTEQSLLAKPDSKLAAKSEQSLLICLTSNCRQKPSKICACVI